MIRITSTTKHGHWRAGIHHPPAPTSHADDAFGAEQLAALKADPWLRVEHIDDAGDDARARTIKAAAEDLLASGAHAPTVDQVTKAAGVGKVSKAERDAAVAELRAAAAKKAS